jgi:hypothetical protein
MKATINESGDLVLKAHPEDRKLLRIVKKERGNAFGSDQTMREFFEHFIANSEYEWVYPEEIMALTSAPILGLYGEDRPYDEKTDPPCIRFAGQWDRDGKLTKFVRPVLVAWGFMDYALRSPLDDLLETGECVFQRGT